MILIWKIWFWSYWTNEIEYSATLKTKIDNWPAPEQQRKHKIFSFSLWNVQLRPQLDRKCSTSTTIGSCTTRRMVCVCLRWQCLRRRFLPIASDQRSAFSFFRSGWKYELLLYECLRLLPHFRCHFFWTCARGKHRAKRSNLRMKAQSFKKSETWFLDILSSSV